ncbi:glycosyltransferase family 4 protein [Mucilaginibacter sp.]|uniref:glycosyltransferase family 4 protein n=1 Tax=Mucilaginibacter sp. TaxID=1882438 RepID=UPI002627D988|nr:glycosyltransferase family 4 protein [Mucilaginibacter sp.]
MAQKIDLKVFYTWGDESVSKYDPGFNKNISWDIDLLTGYNYQWLINTAVNPGSHHFRGIVNPDIINHIQNWQPDTLLVYGWAYSSHLTVIRYFKGKIPILFRGDSTLLDERPEFKNLLRYVYLKWIYKHIDYAMYTGSNNRAYFKKYGLQENQLIFAPHAVDNERFAIPQKKEIIQFKQKLNINSDNILILFAGKFEEKKDPLLLLQAFINLEAANTHLLFVGNGSLELALKQQAVKYPNIHFMDFQNQSYMPVIYQACDIFCLPSKGPGESWGLAVNEAMICGKAILVSNKTGCAIDLVKNNISGYIHMAGSKFDLEEKLHCLINKGKKELFRMGEASKKQIKDWSFTVQANNIVNYKNGRNQ